MRKSYYDFVDMHTYILVWGLPYLFLTLCPQLNKNLDSGSHSLFRTVTKLNYQDMRPFHGRFQKYHRENPKPTNRAPALLLLIPLCVSDTVAYSLLTLK